MSKKQTDCEVYPALNTTLNYKELDPTMRFVVRFKLASSCPLDECDEQPINLTAKMTFKSKGWLKDLQILIIENPTSTKWPNHLFYALL